MKLKDFLKEYNISIDELLENFYVINYNIDNEVQDRITSYNVCYTKLLRFSSLISCNC